MTTPKIKPCLKCGDPDMSLFKYESGWWHAECEECNYFGPGGGSKDQAVRAYNERYAAALSALPADSGTMGEVDRG